MAEFENMPPRIQKVVKAHLCKDERICLCVLGRSSLLRPDFVFITTRRVLVLDERHIGSLAVSYANVRCNVLFTEIRDVQLVRHFKHRLLSQAKLEISVVRNVHWIDNISFRSAQSAYTCIVRQLAQPVLK
ncbi:hypothetical protein F4055_00535 [Candidatus Poribacteria bacterium]|nr:hypothetical protein [Candidatus Poribacteria bacterium]